MEGDMEGREEENMREWDVQEKGRTEKQIKESDILIEGAIKELSRNSTRENPRNSQG